MGIPIKKEDQSFNQPLSCHQKLFNTFGIYNNIKPNMQVATPIAFSLIGSMYTQMYFFKSKNEC